MVANPAIDLYKNLCISVLTPYFNIRIMACRWKPKNFWVPIHIGLIIRDMYSHFMGQFKPISSRKSPKNRRFTQKWVYPPLNMGVAAKRKKFGPNKFYHCVYWCFIHQNNITFRSMWPLEPQAYRFKWWFHSCKSLLDFGHLYPPDTMSIISRTVQYFWTWFSLPIQGESLQCLWKSVDLYLHYFARYNNNTTNIQMHGKA